MKKGIVTRTKISAKELSTTYITLQRNEVFITGKKLFIPASAMSIVFNSKGATRKFDKDDFIVHPTKGKMYRLMNGLEKFVTIVD